MNRMSNQPQLPKDEHQQERPVFLILIPHDALAAERCDDAVQQALICGQEREHEVADNNPGQEVGQEHRRLADLGQLLGLQLGDHDGQRHGQCDAYTDEDDVIAQRVAEDVDNIRGFEEELEVVDADPLTVDQVADKRGISGVDLVVLKCQDDTAHGQVAQQQQPDSCRCHHGQQHKGFLVLTETLGLQSARFATVVVHSFPAPSGLFKLNKSCYNPHIYLSLFY